MWHSAEFEEWLELTRGTHGLWENVIQPQMKSIVSYSLACAQVSNSSTVVEVLYSPVKVRVFLGRGAV